MGRRNGVQTPTAEAPQTQTVSVTQADAIAAPTGTPVVTMTQEAFQKAVAEAVALQMASQTTKAVVQELDWFGDYNLYPMGTLTKGYNGQPGKPSENGYVVPFSTKGVHPDTFKALVKNPSGNLGLAMLYSYMACDLIENRAKFGWAPHIVAHWDEIVARFKPLMGK